MEMGNINVVEEKSVIEKLKKISKSRDLTNSQVIRKLVRREIAEFNEQKKNNISNNNV